MNPLADPSGLFEEWASLDTLLLLLKWGYVFLFGIYFIFSLVVMTQIRQMLASLNGGLDKAILLLGIIQVTIAGLALLTAIVIL